MAARCAGCLEPITRAQKFVLHETEVFHRQCAGQTSVVHRLKMRNTQLAGEVLRVQGQAEVRAQATEREKRMQAQELADAQGQLKVARSAKDAALRDSEYWRTSYDTLHANHQRVVTDRDRLTRELAEARAAAVKPEVAIEREDPESNKMLDSIGVRFGLLELD